MFSTNKNVYHTYLIHAGCKVYDTTLVRYLHESQTLNNVPKNRQKTVAKKRVYREDTLGTWVPTYMRVFNF